MSDSQVTITLPMSEHALGTILFVLSALLLSAIIFGLLPRKGRPSDPMDQLQGKMGLTGLPPVLVLFLAVIWVALFIALLIGIFWVLFGIVDRAAAASTEEALDLRWSLLSLTAITAALGAVISLPFTLIRVALNRRQTETAEQGHITNQINTAVQGLGAEKEISRIGRPITIELSNMGKVVQALGGGKDHATRIEWQGRPPPYLFSEEKVVEEGEWQAFSETKPNLEVRIGAIYALERIAQDSERDHVQIMEILCAYIRQNAPVTEQRSKIRADIQTALNVLGGRSEEQRKLKRSTPTPRRPEGYRLDLKHTCLNGADMVGLNFDRGVFFETTFDYAFLNDASFIDANLKACRFFNTNAIRTDFTCAELHEAEFRCDLEARKPPWAAAIWMRLSSWIAVSAKRNFTDHNSIGLDFAELAAPRTETAWNSRNTLG